MSKNNEFKDTTVQYEAQWAETYLLPEVKKVADFSLRMFVKYFDSHDTDPFTGEKLVRPLRWGADLKIEHENRRIYITEWYVPNAEGKITDDVTGDILPGVHFREYIVTYHMAKDLARRAHQNGHEVKIGLIYIPVFKCPNKYDPDATAWLDEIDTVARARVKQAVELIKGEIDNLTVQYGKENDEGLYVGVRPFYNQETSEVEYIVQKHDAIHFIKDQNIEQNHIALKADEHGFDQTPFYHEKDKHKSNWNYVMSKLMSEKAGNWVRVTHPSKVAIARLADEIVDFLMPQVNDVFIKAEEEVLKVEGLVDGSIRHVYNQMNSGLETHYKVVEKQTKIVNPTPDVVTTDENGVPAFSGVEEEIEVVVDKQFDHGRNKALVLMVAGRIEPELWLPTQKCFERAFNLQYSTVVDTSAVTE